MGRRSLRLGYNRALEAMGDRSSMELLMLTSDEPRTFGQIGRALGIADSVVSKRVAKLLERGLLEREQYCDRPVRYRYSATALTKHLRHARIAIWNWDQRWAPHPADRSVHLIHASCARQVVPTFGCGACGALSVTLDDVRTVVHEGMRTEFRNPAAKRITRIGPQSRCDALTLLGDHWSTSIVGVIMLGVGTFNGLRGVLGDISAATLTEKLNRLIAAGLVAHEPRAHGRGMVYQPTPKALDLFPIFAAIVEWAHLWGEPVGLQFNHSCGHELRVRYTCNACNQPLRPGTTLFISTQSA